TGTITAPIAANAITPLAAPATDPKKLSVSLLINPLANLTNEPDLIDSLNFLRLSIHILPYIPLPFFIWNSTLFTVLVNSTYDDNINDVDSIQAYTKVL